MTHEVAEETLCGVIRCNACGQNDARTACGSEKAADGFCEDGVCVDVARGGKRKAVALAKKLADAISGVDGSDKLGVQCWVVLHELGYQPSAGGLVRRSGNPW